MKKIIGLVIFYCFGAGLSYSQTTEEFHLVFKTKKASEAYFESQHLSVNPPEDIPFTGVSAYILEPYCDADLWYRLKSNDEWGSWIRFRKNEEGLTKGRTTYEGSLIEESFSDIQFRSSAASSKEFVFRLYFPDTQKKSLNKSIQSKADTSCNCVQPDYCGRDCWCPSGNCPEDSTQEMTTPTHMIIHHSAGSTASGDFAALVAYYWDLHVNTNGWDDIGYNWLIDPDGVIYEGRGSGVLGAHFSCMNSETSGICLIGNFENTTPTVPAVSKLNYLLAWEACDKEIAPGASSLHESSQLILPNISSHRDGNHSTAPESCASGTLCPGENLYNMLYDIRIDIANNPCLGALSGKNTKMQEDIDIYPNPSHNILHIKTEGYANSSLQSLEVLSMTGQSLGKFEKLAAQGKEVTIRIDHLSPGNYLLKINFKDSSLHKIFIKN